MLTVSFVFEVLETSDECYWRSVNLREASVANFEAFARSTVQRVFELVAFKARKETVLAQKVNSLSVMEKFAIKCKTPEVLLWCVASVADSIQQKFLATNDFSLRAVSGTKGSGKASKGLIDLFIMKKELLDWLKGKFVPAHPFHESVVTALAGFKSHQEFRALCGGPSQQVDIAWMGTMSESGRKLFALLKVPGPLLLRCHLLTCCCVVLVAQHVVNLKLAGVILCCLPGCRLRECNGRHPEVGLRRQCVHRRGCRADLVQGDHR
jgi:hypothetical protein